MYENSAQVSQHSAAEWRIEKVWGKYAAWQLWVHWVFEILDQCFCVISLHFKQCRFFFIGLIFFLLVGWLCVAKCSSRQICLPFLWWRLREYRESGTIQIPKASSVGKPSRSPLFSLVQRSEQWFPLAGFYRDTESSITPKPFPDKPNDMITDDILHYKLV